MPTAPGNIDLSCNVFIVHEEDGCSLESGLELLDIFLFYCFHVRMPRIFFEIMHHIGCGVQPKFRFWRLAKGGRPVLLPCGATAAGCVFTRP